MPHSELTDVTLLFAVSLAVGLGFQRLRVPAVVGFVVAGAAIGPHSLGLVENEHLVEQLAEVGVVILLFTVGLELAGELRGPMRRLIAVCGAVQVLATAVLGCAVALLMGTTLGLAILLGFLLSLSSTAAITKLLGERGELASPPGRLAVAICVAQDIAVVPMILVLPLLASAGSEPVDGSGSVASAAGGVAMAFLALALVVGAARIFVPRLLRVVSATRSRELFVLAVVTVCMVLAMATGQLGLSPALGAFLAGFVLAQGQHKHQAVAEVEPLRDALSSLFFVSIGMLFDVRVLIEQPLVVGVAVAAVVIGKATMAWFSATILALPRWVSIRGALMVAQVGEFSFVMVQAGRDSQILDAGLHRVFVVVAVLSIGLTPMLFALGRALTARPARSSREGVAQEEAGPDGARDHAILVGFGPAGRILADAFEAIGIPYVVIEMNPATVRAERSRGRAIEFGDASRRAVLTAAGAQRARILVVAVDNARASRQIVAVASDLAPHLRVLARAHYMTDIDGLKAAGADDVVGQELETSIEIAVRALRLLLVPDDVIGHRVREVRQHFGAPRSAPEPARALGLEIPDLDVRVARVEPASDADGRTLQQLALRATAGLTIVARQAHDAHRAELSVGAETRLESGDRVVVVGPVDRMEPGLAVFRSAPGED